MAVPDPYDGIPEFTPDPDHVDYDLENPNPPDPATGRWE